GQGTEETEGASPADGKLQLLLGVRGSAGKCLGDSLKQRRRVAKELSRRLSRKLAFGKFEQIFRRRIRIAHQQVVGQQYHRRREELQAGVIDGILFDGEMKRLTSHRVPPAVQR